MSAIIAITSLLITFLPPSSNAADLSVQSTLSTCHNLTTGKDTLLRSASCFPSSLTVAHWVLQTSLTSDTPWPQGSLETLLTCTNRPGSTRTFLVIRKRCLASEVSRTYIRFVSQPSQPELLSVSARSSQSATLQVKVSAANEFAPITKFAVRINGGEIRTVSPTPSGEIVISGLKAATDYQFEIASISADGVSDFSQSSVVISTPVEIIEKVLQSNPSSGSTTPSEPVLLPVFTLPAGSLTLTYPYTNSYRPTATGGAIDSFSVTTLPQGLKFDSATAAISGHPSEAVDNLMVTLTAFNSYGTYSKSFSMTTVMHTYQAGDVGPGGGRVFRYEEAGFACGPTLTQTCHNLEYAPHYWSGGNVEPVLPWSSSVTAQNLSRNYFSFGKGILGSLEIAGQSTDRNNAAAQSLDYRGGGFQDWYLPNLGEVTEIKNFIITSSYPGGFGIYEGDNQIVSVAGLSGIAGLQEHLGEFTPTNYWTSNDFALQSAGTVSNGPTFFSFHDDTTYFSEDYPNVTIYTRPIRAF